MTTEERNWSGTLFRKPRRSNLLSDEESSVWCGREGGLVIRVIRVITLGWRRATIHDP